MAPRPQEHALKKQDIISPEMHGDRIVISGMSGLYPQSHNIKEFCDILYKKENPVSSENVRWKFSHPEVAQHSGNIPDLDRFDAQFFKVHYRLANNMDPMSRKILEQAHNAIYDAGINSEEISGRKIGVFIGSCFSEAEKAFYYDSSTGGGYGIAGCSKAMFANRISYWLNAKGPSVAIDEACCSSAAALEQAYLAMTRGECEAALVGGSYLCMHPQSSVHYGRIIKQAMDGKTKSFDENADGCVKSEAINVLFLQKAKDALRVYAEVLYAKTEFIGLVQGETGPKYGFLRQPENTVEFLKRFYEEARIPPKAVEYVEAFGCAMLDADKVELGAIDSVICEGKDTALLVGSVTSNIGYVEAATGISGITKVLLGYHTGQLAANLHCEHPRQDVEALREGRIKIVTDHQKFGRSYAAVNGISVTGVNSHILLHGRYKPKDLSRYKSNIPHIVTLSARQDTAVTKIIEDLKSRSIDPEELALFHNIHQVNVSDHLGRGYVILDTNEEEKTISLAEKVEYFNEPNRPLWFVYSGMGSQWAGMGSQLMRIPIFAAAIERCRQVLEPKGIDIVHIITTDDDKIFDNILHSFVGIAAVQIGLTDVLRELGLVPDGIIGHSVGELGCAYADGCLTAEEMILSAYSRGLVSLQTPFIRGSMAAVGLGYEKVSKLIPPEIEVACHNGPESSTISGPSEIMREFVAELTAKGVFAKEVPCSNIAYHSRYIAKAGPTLRAYLKEVIKTPKKRTERWVSTSVPKNRWNEELAQFSSADYHTNNLLSPVLLEETLPEISANAVLVEVAPHGLLQAILKRSLPVNCKNIALTRRKHPDNTLLLLQAVGNLYMAGYNPKVQVLYPKIEMPVSTGTPFLSHNFGWAHGEKWATPYYETACRRQATVCNWIVSLHDKEHQYLEGHIFRRKTSYPFAATLVAVWDTLAMIMGVPKKMVSVVFRDVSLYVLPMLHDQSQLKIRVQLERGSGHFEVLNEEILIASGYVDGIKVDNAAKSQLERNDDDENMNLNSDNIYDLLEERGYLYSGAFRCIERANTSLSKAELVWNNNWVTFIDSLFQINALKQAQDKIPKLKQIRKLYININKHNNLLNDVTEDKILMKAEANEAYGITSCGGITIEEIRFCDVPMTTESKFKLQSLKVEQNGDTSIDSRLRGEHYKPVDKNIKSENVILRLSQFGNLESLHWVNAPEVIENELKVDVHFASLSNNDFKKANGTILFEKGSDNCFGMDFSGINKNGERVMGIVAGGAASNQVCADPTMLWPVPKHWSLEEAATVPLAYIQALYVLVLKNEVLPGSSVLIHGGCGALGQAAIAVALSIGCKVFTTVSDRRKKEFLLKRFPELKDNHISSSRDDSFADMVLVETNGVGCDYVISNVKQDLKNSACKCVASFGCVVDLSQLHTQEHYTYGMYNLTKGRSYSAIDLTSIFNDKNKQVLRRLQIMLSEGIARGFVRPLSRIIYSAQEPTRAFSLLASSSHRGRILLRMKDISLSAINNRISCNPEHCQLVLYNNEKAGLQVAERLVNRGATRLHIHNANRSSAKLDYKIRSWQKSGVVIQTTSGNFDSMNVKALLNDAKRLGPIQGIYSVIGPDQNINESMFTDLDRTSRTLCPNLRYFAILNYNDTAIGMSTCISRIRDKLPAASLSLAELITARNESCWNAMDAMEQALRLPDAVLKAKVVPDDKPTLLQQIAALADITIANNIPKTATLEDLGIKNDKLQAIVTFLRNTFNMSLTDTDIPFLTLKTILDLENSEIVFEDIKGLGAFFSRTDCDELMATTDMIPLTTMTGSKLRDDEFDASQSYLYIVPGMEGHHERFQRLCERLKLSAFVIQPGLDHPHESVHDTAKRFAELLVKKTHVEDDFYLLGYESGILVALEMAKIFEEQGKTGTVYCIGYAPDEFKPAIEEYLSEYKTEEQFQNALVLHIFKMMTDIDPTELQKALENKRTWRQKVDICVRLLKGHVSHSMQYISTFIDAALVRIEQARRYKAKAHPLRSRLVLLRPATQHDTPTTTSLQQHSQQPVVVHQLRLPLAHAAQDARCAAIINSYLSREILKDFEDKNICEAYLTNSDCFMSKQYIGE